MQKLVIFLCLVGMMMSCGKRNAVVNPAPGGSTIGAGEALYNQCVTDCLQQRQAEAMSIDTIRSQCENSCATSKN